MNINRHLAISITSITFAAFALPVLAQDHSSHSGHAKPATSVPADKSTGDTKPDVISGEVRKIDKDAKKITLKHGEIKSLDMTAMTMVFQVKDAKMLDGVKVGDKVNFVPEKTKSGYAVTSIEVAK